MADEAPKKKKRPFWRKRFRRSTAAGEHRPVLLDEVLAASTRSRGRSSSIARSASPGTRSSCCSASRPTACSSPPTSTPRNIEPARAKLDAVGGLFALHHANFAGLPNVLAAEGVPQVDGLLADLGMSSMQVDDRDRGFSFMRDGPLDMRMDRTRGRTAAELLNTLPDEELAAALPRPRRRAAGRGDRRRDRGDSGATKPHRAHEGVARADRAARPRCGSTAPPARRPERKQLLGPATRVFQALRILVNRELANLQQLLRVLPTS